MGGLLERGGVGTKPRRVNRIWTGRGKSKFILSSRWEGQGRLENHRCLLVGCVLVNVNEPGLEMG